MLIAWMGVGSGLLVALISWLSVRASRQSAKDTRAANELEARDRTIEQRDRFTDQIQEERDRLTEQLHDALDRIDLQVGQIRTLEEQNAALRNKP